MLITNLIHTLSFRSRVMSNEATATLIHGRADMDSTIHTVHEIVPTVEQIIATGIEQIALVTIQLFYEKEEELNTRRLSFAKITTQYLLDDLRVLVRRTDSVLQSGHNLYFLLHGANIL